MTTESRTRSRPARPSLLILRWALLTVATFLVAAVVYVVMIVTSF
jgi:hypothetical protein